MIIARYCIKVNILKIIAFGENYAVVNIFNIYAAIKRIFYKLLVRSLLSCKLSVFLARKINFKTGKRMNDLL